MRVHSRKGRGSQLAEVKETLEWGEARACLGVTQLHARSCWEAVWSSLLDIQVGHGGMTLRDALGPWLLPPGYVTLLCPPAAPLLTVK